MSHSSQILAQIAISYYPEAALKLRQIIVPNYTVILEKFISGQIDYQTAAKCSLGFGGTCDPVNRLKQIMETSEEPLPINENEPEFLSSRKKTRTWTAYEDQRLLAGILRYGIENWTAVSRFVGNGRSRSQCSQRWTRVMDPRINRSIWSQEEGHRLLDLVQQYGDRNWSQIAAQMQTRTDIQCRYKYNQIRKTPQNTDSNQEIDDGLDFVGGDEQFFNFPLLGTESFQPPPPPPPPSQEPTTQQGPTMNDLHMQLFHPSPFGSNSEHYPFFLNDAFEQEIHLMSNESIKPETITTRCAPNHFTLF